MVMHVMIRCVMSHMCTPYALVSVGVRQTLLCCVVMAVLQRHLNVSGQFGVGIVILYGYDAACNRNETVLYS
jgi:hypothetical protein